jgi:hypothetical protein
MFSNGESASNPQPLASPPIGGTTRSYSCIAARAESNAPWRPPGVLITMHVQLLSGGERGMQKSLVAPLSPPHQLEAVAGGRSDQRPVRQRSQRFVRARAAPLHGLKCDSRLSSCILLLLLY